MFPLSNGNNGDSCMKNGGASSCENSYAAYTTHSGLTSGIPTRTTPTLTPTTLKNIEESFMNLNSMPQPPVEHHRQAGFVPPVVNISMLSQNSDSNGSYASYPMSVKEEDNSQWLPACMQASLSPNSNNSSESNTSSNKGRSGGRRRSGRSERLSPEEEERRRVRRERNKLAAARCRKRRMDHTNSLLDETEGLEDKRQQLQEEIARLRAQKDDLEFLLEAHKANCKINQHHHHNNNNHNSHHHNRVQVTSTTTVVTQPKLEQSVIVSTSSVSKGAATRPTSLSINPNFSNNPGSSGYKRSSVQYSEVTGIPINTPSNGIFNFESLMDGGTGFTPITNCSTGLTPINTGLTPLISCAGQQRSSSSDLSSPDTMNNPKLVSL